MRVLIVRTGAMGDVIHALPAVAALRARHPGWFIGWAVEPRWSELLQTAADTEPGSDGKPLVDTVHLVPVGDWKRQPFSRETIASVKALRAELRAGRYDLCVDMQGIIRASLIGRMAGAPTFAGKAEPREKPARWLYSHRVQMTAPHVVEQGCELLGAATGEPIEPARAVLPIDPANERWAEEMTGGEEPCFIAPTAGWGAKAWPPERFGEVAARLGQAGLRTLVNAAPGDETAAIRLVAASEGWARAIPKCSVGQLVALLRRARVVIAGDTGPLHLAAALGRPVVGIYGPTDPARNGPYGTRSVVLRNAESVTNHSRVSEVDPGMLRVEVEAVVEAVEGLLGKTAEAI